MHLLSNIFLLNTKAFKQIVNRLIDFDECMLMGMDSIYILSLGSLLGWIPPIRAEKRIRKDNVLLTSPIRVVAGDAV